MDGNWQCDLIYYVLILLGTAIGYDKNEDKMSYINT